MRCRLEVVPGAFHAFDMIAKNAAVSRSFFASQCLSLRDNTVLNQTRPT